MPLTVTSTARGESPKSRYQSSSGRAGVLERLAATSVLSPMAIDCSGRSSGSTSARCAGLESGAGAGEASCLRGHPGDEEQDRQGRERAHGAHARAPTRAPRLSRRLEWMAPRARCSVSRPHMTLSPLLAVVLSAVPGLGHVQATDGTNTRATPPDFQPLQRWTGI